jgi:hypothetical protein
MSPDSAELTGRSSIRLRLLGSFEASTPDGVPIRPPGRRSVALLACLALEDGRPWSRETLAALLWHGRDPEQARISLRQELKRLRRAFGPGIATGDGTAAERLRLRADGVEIDVARLRRAASERARAGEVLAIYRGELLEGFALPAGLKFAEWLAQSRRALRSIEYLPDVDHAWIALTCALGLQDRLAEARETAQVLRQITPRFGAWRFYWTARFFYGRRFAGPVREDYRNLRGVLARALG